ncbi:MAG: Trm112 family protein [Comamonadaceae bacterium]|nr:MAG: Trm112 family protein [Comamonadaceae bacterium]
METRLFDILVCPVSKGPLEFDRTKNVLISRTERLSFPIRDGIPVLLVSEASPLDPVAPPAPAAP